MGSSTFSRGRGAGQEIEALENEAEFFVPQVGQLVAVERGDIDVVEQVEPARGPVEAAQRIHQRGFAGAAGAHQRHHLPLVELERDAAHA